MTADSLNIIDAYLVISFSLICVVAPVALILILRRIKNPIFLEARAWIGFLLMGFFIWYIGVFSFWLSFYGPDYIKDMYVKPQIEIPASPKNLVVIYAESLEKTFSEKDLFGEDLLEDLTTLSKEAISFNNVDQAPSSDWTIASIVSSQCGIPLQKPLEFFNDNQKKLDESHGFLPGATCMGDLLFKNNYHQVFINGVSLNFAGVGSFFKTHKFNETYGLEEWKEKFGEKLELHEWGANDFLVLDQAKEQFNKLYKQNKPFNLTVLTVDTHIPKGLPSSECKAKYGENLEYGSVIKCTSSKIAETVKYIRKNDTRNNTIILVVGDHLSMKNLYTSKLNTKKRSIFASLFIPNKEVKEIENKVYAVDFFPILLSELSGKGICEAGIGSVPHPMFNCKGREIPDAQFVEAHFYKSKLVEKFWRKP